MIERPCRIFIRSATKKIEICRTVKAILGCNLVYARGVMQSLPQNLEIHEKVVLLESKTEEHDGYYSVEKITTMLEEAGAEYTYIYDEQS